MTFIYSFNVLNFASVTFYMCCATDIEMPEKRVEEDIFLVLEKYNKCKIPDCVKSILSFAAFDTACSLSGLNENAISIIENYVNQSDKSVINQLDCCNADKYQRQTNFRFLPGHSSILLEFPDQIKQMNESKKKPYKKLSESKKLLTPAELKNFLLQKLNQHLEKSRWTQKIGIFTEAHLSNVETMISENTMTAKCKVKCISCENWVPILYNGSWTTGNVYRHMKIHLTADDERRDTDNLADNNESKENNTEHSQNYADVGEASEEATIPVLSVTSQIVDMNPAEIDNNRADSLISHQVQMENGFTYEEIYVDKCNNIGVDNSNNIKSVSIGSGKSIQFNMKIE